MDLDRHAAQGPLERRLLLPAFEHFRARSSSPREFPAPAEIMFAGWADHGRTAAAGGSKGRGLDPAGRDDERKSSTAGDEANIVHWPWITARE